MAPGCDVCTTSLTVHGQVTAGFGPVADARVDARSYAGACADSIMSGESSLTARSDATGAFNVRVLSLLGPRDHCVVLSVRSPEGSPWRDTVVTIPTVRMESDYPSPSSIAFTRNVILGAR